MPESIPIDDLFLEAIRLPADERAAFVESCPSELRDRLAMLLEAHEEAPDFLEKPAVEPPVMDPTIQAPLLEGPGTTIDRYKLLQLVGEGGFGAVYMAEQRDPVKRRVALKIIKLGMDTKQVIARFEAERQALAMMDHPNIARVFDAGATDTGRPYFVMELVKGVSITEYCDTETLTTKQRLELFTSVCNAVQHAHLKGIIHRDLKPSNVMVTLHDGKPVPKVIDFGIAKATNRELTDKTLFTEYRQFIGTPEYMSPEQAEMSGLDIDTRSDIYALGVLLYELLTGVTPFDGKRLRSAALNEIQRIIREEEPHRPSTRLSELSHAAGPALAESESSEHSSVQDIARHRRSDPGSLSKQLRGDLDRIVMKALEKDRARRYETANGFAMDIGRYLNDEPVTASPPSATYKLAKLVKRNKGACTAAAVVFLALTLGVVSMTWGLFKAAEANEELVGTNSKLDAALEDANKQRALALEREMTAVVEAERAERELARANEVKRLIADMFRGVSPEVAQGADIELLKGILDDTAQRLASGEVSDELIAAELHRIVGGVYRRLGLFEDSERQMRLSLTKHESMYGAEHGATRSSRGALAHLYLDWGRWTEAEAIFAPLLEAARKDFGEREPFVLKTMTNLGVVYNNLGRHSRAETLYVQALPLMKEVLGPEDANTLRCMNNLGALYWSLERYEEAEPLMIDVLEIRESVLGPKDPETLGAMMNLANLYRMRGSVEKAELLYLRALELMRIVLTDEHPRTSLCISNLGNFYRSQQRFAEAEPLLHEALEHRRKMLGPENEDALGSMMDLGILYNAMGRHEDALPLLKSSVADMRRLLYPDHPFWRAAMQALAEAYTGLGRNGEALELQRELLETTEEPQ